MGVKDICLSLLFPDAPSGFQLVNKLTVWFIRPQGDQVNCWRSPSQQCVALGWTQVPPGFQTSTLMFGCFPSSNLAPQCPLPHQQTGQTFVRPSLQVGFLAFIQHVLNLVDSVKPESILKLCFECTGVREQYQSPICNAPSPLNTLTDALTDRKTSVVPNQRMSRAGNTKKGHCSPNTPSLGWAKAPANAGEIHTFWLSWTIFCPCCT